MRSNGSIQIEFTLGSPEFGNINVKKADQVLLEFLPDRLASFRYPAIRICRVVLKAAMEGGTPQMPYRLAAGHSGASVCRTYPVEPPSLQRRAMHRLKHGMKHLQVMQARGA